MIRLKQFLALFMVLTIVLCIIVYQRTKSLRYETVLKFEAKPIYFNVDIEADTAISTRPVVSEQIKDGKEDYFQDLYGYVTEWKRSLESGKSHLATYIDLLDRTHDLLVREQVLEFQHNITERPVPLDKQLDCSNPDYSSFLQQNLKSQPQRVLDFILFSYELVILEIRLFELYDVVDEFIIFESNITFRRLRKPWFFLQNLKRYQRFLNKITLMTPFNVTRFNPDGTIKTKIEIPEKDVPIEFKSQPVQPGVNDANFFQIDFSFEKRVRMLPVDLYRKLVRHIEPDEITINGDLDEVPSGGLINHFKYCQVKDQLYPFNVYSTFYIYGFKFLFQSDYPMPNDKYSLPYPNIFQMKNIIQTKSVRINHGFKIPNANGVHLNRFFFTFTIPLFKDFSQSDSTGIDGFNLDIIKAGSKDNLFSIQSAYDRGDAFKQFRSRIRKIDLFDEHKRGRVFIPWVVLANKHVYEKYF
jgi:hypothetical protein